MEILKKAILELIDGLGDSPDVVVDKTDMACALLVWARLSSDGVLPLEERLTADDASGFNHFYQTNFNGSLPKAGFVPSDKVRESVNRFVDSGVISKIEFADLAYAADSKKQVFTVIPGFADVLTQLAQCKKNDHFYCPYEETGQLALRISAHTKKPVYVEYFSNSLYPCLAGLLAKPKPVINSCDPILKPSAVSNGDLDKFDKTISITPFGKKYRTEDLKGDLFGRFPSRVTTGNVLAAYHMLAQTKKRLVICQPVSFLFSRGAEAELRRKLVAEGIVQSVTEFPSGVFQGTGVKSCVLVLDPEGGNQSIRFVDASNYVETEKRVSKLVNQGSLVSEILTNDEDTATARTVTNEELLANDVDLSVGRYVVSQDQIALGEKLAKSQKVQLREVCQSVGTIPASAIKKDLDTENTGYITARMVDTTCFPEYGYLRKPSKKVFVENKFDARSKFYLQPNDILVVTKASVGKVGIVPADVPRPGEGGWIAPPSVTVLRYTDSSSMDPLALCMQLRSPLGQMLLGQLVVGSTIPMIRIKDLLEMNVLFLSKEVSSRVVQAFNQEIEIQKKIDELKEQQFAITAKIKEFEV